ncbi:hypothetical protein TREMEDRAFT_72810 [Tremella mesenterica DSM 1558]|uniref:uncharacterized protein n=1 Tax=Tremella mesenterica (strain ATCC 24925 / CBS 8224 / DSM 1558 / NBRC 9311 / NRRL Y-6157 / RJB 2259-6 / UBC 559-6) TaxID=578456 RepID=UPI0003F49690|nr:uncharacterized protein TREMEDRAFT_72810 [Tremella mesenterica DSM 1558]EIW72574.1 hypothetical protein TREMEDRAFT_72810 [Tremella mesenterica DSM 1558]
MSSDPFDDDLFDDLDTSALEAIEAQAIAVQSSQAPKRHTERYHHTVAVPRNSPAAPIRPSNPAKTGGPTPRPLNTEPRAGNTGFGWEFGGKRSIDGNVERHVQAVKDRQVYWNGKEEESYPDITVNAQGQYGLGQGYGEEAEVMDSHARPVMESLTEVRKEKGGIKGSAARRAAITLASQNSQGYRAQSEEISVPPRIPSVAPVEGRNDNDTVQPLPKFNNNRSFSRSVSMGAQVSNRTLYQNHNSLHPTRTLAPIPSQSSQGSSSQMPGGSQSGALTRRTALELEEERRKREKLEQEIRLLRKTGEKSQLASRVEEPVAESSKDAEKRMKELQAELWRAKGEAESVRRAQRDEHAKHLAEAERLKAQVAEMEGRLREREKEAARQLESVRTQAIFSNHAVHNSAVKMRQASQRPMMPPLSPTANRIASTPFRGSPSRRESLAEVTPLIKTLKGKMIPPPPKFEHLNNAFVVAPSLGTGKKRARNETVSPPASPTRPPASFSAAPRDQTPLFSPNKSQIPGSSLPQQADDGMELDPPEALPPEEVEVETGEFPIVEDPIELRAELIHHLFSHIPLSTIQFEMHYTREPTIFRILNYRHKHPSTTEDFWNAQCSALLTVCGDGSMPFDVLCGSVGSCLLELADLASTLIIQEGSGIEEICVLINILNLLSSTAFLFPHFSTFSPTPNGITISSILSRISGYLGDTSQCQNINSRLTSERAESEKLGRWEALEDTIGIWEIELAQGLVNVGMAMSCWPDYRGVWSGADLVDVILDLLSRHLDTQIHVMALDLFYLTSLHKDNLRPLIATSTKHKPDLQPLIDRLSRWLISPTLENPDEASKWSVKVIRGLTMMAIADPDAVVLLAEKTILIAALILVLGKEGGKVWGVTMGGGVIDSINLILPTLTLFHHLIYPLPLLPRTPSQLSKRHSWQSQQQSQFPTQSRLSQLPPNASGDFQKQGVNLPHRLQFLSGTKEFNGLQHVFVSALGMMAYGETDIDESEDILREIQYLSQDLLESVVEGPEGDAIYELYTVEPESNRDRSPSLPSSQLDHRGVLLDDLDDERGIEYEKDSMRRNGDGIGSGGGLDSMKKGDIWEESRNRKGKEVKDVWGSDEKEYKGVKSGTIIEPIMVEDDEEMEVLAEMGYDD